MSAPHKPQTHENPILKCVENNYYLLSLVKLVVLNL